MMVANRQQAIEVAIDAHFRQLDQRKECPNSATKYVVREAFGGIPYWWTKVRAERFQTTLQKGILYRPSIVEDMCRLVNHTLSLTFPGGVMVRGPHGVGKSHSLVSMVLRLESVDRHLVTFVPNCEKWEHSFHFLETVCSSFGTTPSALGFNVLEWGKDSELTRSVAIDALIGEVAAALRRRGKKWVFVFDQVNRIFARPGNANARDAGVLPFPFKLIKSVCAGGIITSVISASANNEMAYRHSHEGFQAYDHDVRMTEEELRLLFEGDAGLYDEGAIEMTGRVPLFVAQYLSDPDNFLRNLDSDVQLSLLKLESDSPNIWRHIKDSIISSLLELPSQSTFFDRKYFVPEEVLGRQFFKPLVPMVLASCRFLYWDDLMNAIDSREEALLTVCRDPGTTNDARGRHFEHIVIRRCQTEFEVEIGDETIHIPPNCTHFKGHELPKSIDMAQDGVYVPNSPLFPAIDLVWKSGNRVYGVQVHVAEHADVVAGFEGLCKAAGWHTAFSICLVYLSPEERVKNLVEGLVAGQHECHHLRGEAPWCIERKAITGGDVSCLRGLQWHDVITS